MVLYILLGILFALSIAAFVLLPEGSLRIAWNMMMNIYEERAKVRTLFAEWPILAPIFFIALQITQVVISFVPGEATGILGGFLFGPWLGLIYSIIGLTIGSMASFFAGRYFRALIKHYIEQTNIYNRLENLAEHQGIFITFIFYLIPGFPKDILCYIMGFSRIPWQAFFIISTIGRIPGTWLLTIQGADLYDGNIHHALAIFTVSLLCMVPVWFYREKIYTWIEKHTLKD
ncbi:MAG: TVP38/TMEM64 family protein [Dissulfuribacterales bacterium]